MDILLVPSRVAEEQTLVVSVPTQGHDTWYARAGDVVAYAGAVGLLVLTGVAWTSHRHPGGAHGRTRPSPSDQTERPPPLDGVPAG